MLLLTLPSPASATEVRHGMDHGSVETLREAGLEPDLGTVWTGAWAMGGGWTYVADVLRDLAEQNVTPLVHAYYWGDDIDESCFSEGCDGKSMAEWDAYLENLTAVFDDALGGKPVVVVVETEFNKGSVHDWEPLDGILAERIAVIEGRYPAAETVLGLGSFFTENWDTWDRAAAAADLVGTQLLKASSRNDEASFLEAAADVREDVALLTGLFGKPVFLTDVALSSFPDETHLELQATALAAILKEVTDTTDGRLSGVVYRQLVDSPDRSNDDHFGEAERHWGLVHANGTWKPAMTVWATWVRGAEETAGASADEMPDVLVAQSAVATPQVSSNVTVDAEVPAAAAQAATVAPILLSVLVVTTVLTVRRHRRGRGAAIPSSAPRP